MKHCLRHAVNSRTTRRALGLGSIVLLVGILMAAAVFGLTLARQNATQPTSGQAPDFTLTTFDGQYLQTVRFARQSGGRQLLGELVRSLPRRSAGTAIDLGSLSGSRGRGLSSASPMPITVRARWRIIKEFGITYLNGPDLGTRISDEYNIQGVPETFVIDKQGNVAQFIYAGITQSAVERHHRPPAGIGVDQSMSTEGTIAAVDHADCGRALAGAPHSAPPIFRRAREELARQKERDALLTTYERTLASLRDVDEDHLTGKLVRCGLRGRTHLLDRSGRRGACRRWKKLGGKQPGKRGESQPARSSQQSRLISRLIADAMLDDAIEQTIANYIKSTR